MYAPDLLLVFRIGRVVMGGNTMGGENFPLPYLFPHLGIAPSFSGIIALQNNYLRVRKPLIKD